MKINADQIAKALRRLQYMWVAGVGIGVMAVAMSVQAQSLVYGADVAEETIYLDPNNHQLQLKLGGFSGLYPVPGDKTGTLFWTITDRGPTQDFVVTLEDGTNKVTHKVLPCAYMSPMILKLQLKPNGTVKIMQKIPLKKMTARGAKPIMGWVNGVELEPREVLEDIYLNPLPNDPDGLDPEGITMDGSGNFWICEEYRPSIAMVSPDGMVVLRLVPKGTLTGKEVIPTFDVLPAVLTKRVNNRGMEGITFTPNGRLYVVVQRPLANPDKAASDGGCNLRLVEVDVSGFLLNGDTPAVRQFIYRVDGVPNNKVYASDIFALSANVMLVPERKTDKLFAIDISSATDITPLEDEDGVLIGTDPGVTIEMLDAAGLEELEIIPVQKTVVLSSLTKLHKELTKCEGLCVVDGMLYLTYDNDFNLGDVGDASTMPVTIGLKSPDVYPAIIATPMP